MRAVRFPPKCGFSRTDDLQREILSVLIRDIDGDLAAIACGPAKPLHRKIQAALPIENCSVEDFENALKQSRYFVGISELRTYFIGTLVHGNVEVGISLRRQPADLRGLQHGPKTVDASAPRDARHRGAKGANMPAYDFEIGAA